MRSCASRRCGRTKAAHPDPVLTRRAQSGEGRRAPRGREDRRGSRDDGGGPARHHHRPRGTSHSGRSARDARGRHAARIAVKRITLTTGTSTIVLDGPDITVTAKAGIRIAAGGRYHPGPTVRPLESSTRQLGRRAGPSAGARAPRLVQARLRGRAPRGREVPCRARGRQLVRHAHDRRKRPRAPPRRWPGQLPPRARRAAIARRESIPVCKTSRSPRKRRSPPSTTCRFASRSWSPSTTPRFTCTQPLPCPRSPSRRGYWCRASRWTSVTCAGNEHQRQIPGSAPDRAFASSIIGSTPERDQLPGAASDTSSSRPRSSAARSTSRLSSTAAPSSAASRHPARSRVARCLARNPPRHEVEAFIVERAGHLAWLFLRMFCHESAHTLEQYARGSGGGNTPGQPLYGPPSGVGIVQRDPVEGEWHWHKPYHAHQTLLPAHLLELGKEPRRGHSLIQDRLHRAR